MAVSQKAGMLSRARPLCAPLWRLAHRHFGDIRSSYIPFDDVIYERRCQAQRSVLVQVNSDLSFPELHSYCSQFGSILGVHHYTVSNSQQHFMLVEFNNEAGASQITSSSCFIEEFNVIPVQSSFMWFRPPSNKKYNIGKKISDYLNTETSSELVVKNGCAVPKDSALNNALLNADSLSSQMDCLFQMTHLNDLGIRLRYLVARQIECVFSGLYPKIKVHPFGSSVNSFGKLGCDLDLVMKFVPENTEDELKSRLVFHTKKSVSSERAQQQRYMEIISDMIQLFVPGCSHVRRILQARIPIIKYNQDYGGLECDLSMNSLSGLYMSELLYLFGNFDSRVRPLVFTVRKWAQQVNLTNPSPGKWITNFPLTLMVLFFLQNTNNGPILPSFNYMKKQHTEKDVRITEDSVNCTFLRDIKKSTFKTENNSSLEELLKDFFEFYANFDYTSRAISINEGKLVNKFDYSALYIINPLEISLNVSKNVSFEECERLKLECRNALWILEEHNERRQNEVWGITALFRKIGMIPKRLNPQRMVVVKDLFDEETDDDEIVDDHDGKKMDAQEFRRHLLKASEDKTADVLYKNNEIKERIKDAKEESNAAMRETFRLIGNINNKNNSTENPKRKVRRR